MNILIAKTIIQSYVNENDIALYENNANKNFRLLCKQSVKDEEFEVFECLTLVNDLRMIHILANKGE